MSDQELRRREAAFLASGSVADEAAWLRARLAAGELEPGRLELAARCGHQGACELLGREAPLPLGEVPRSPAERLWRWLRPSLGREDLHLWFESLEGHGHEACGEALSAAMDLLVEPDLGLGLAVVSLTNAQTTEGTLAAIGEVVEALCADQSLAPALVQERVCARLVAWALGSPPAQGEGSPG